MSKNRFIDIELTYDNLDIYHVRTSIFKFLKNALPEFEGKLLDFGCGKMPYRSYIIENSKVNQYVGLDIENAITYDTNIKPDVTWDGNSMPFPDESFDCAFGTEVLEHCPEPEVTLKEVHRVLRPGGFIFFTVPFLWNLHEVPQDEYRYTPFSLERHLKNSGFDRITINATGGWHASMAQMLGLWVRRSPMSRRKRYILSRFLRPVIHYLIKKDKPEAVNFKERQMITGLYGFARK